MPTPPASSARWPQGASVNSRNRLGETALVIVLKNNKVDLAQKIARRPAPT